MFSTDGSTSQKTPTLSKLRQYLLCLCMQLRSPISTTYLALHLTVLPCCDRRLFEISVFIIPSQLIIMLNVVPNFVSFVLFYFINKFNEIVDSIGWPPRGGTDEAHYCVDV